MNVDSNQKWSKLGLETEVVDKLSHRKIIIFLVKVERDSNFEPCRIPLVKKIEKRFGPKAKH
jgi:hypothetical protein